MPKVLVADPIAAEGIDLLRREGMEVVVKTGMPREELLSLLGDCDALVVRSETKVTAEVLRAAPRLQVVGRAGVGVDNIDLDAATAQGVAVVNAPTGNIVAAAEHTVALLLALARSVPQADASLRRGEWKRSAFVGVEVRNKVLGLVGLGKVGSEVVRLLQGFNMRRLAYDPFISPDFARLLGVEVVALDQLLREADFLSLHVPLTKDTRNLIGREQLAAMKPGARLINVARGGLVDEEALLEALERGHLAGAALDVFAQEPLPGDSPLLRHPKVIVTPHLGASTTEAQRDVAIEVAEQVLAVLRGQPARNTLNLPALPPEVHAVVAPFVPVAQVAGRLATGLADGQFLSLELSYQGEVARYSTNILKAAALVGLLGPVTADRINVINAPLVAQQRGLPVTEEKSTEPSAYGSLVTVTLNTSKGPVTVAGTLIRGEVHIVLANGYWMDVVPAVPYLLFVEHQDRPGMIGQVGTVTGRHDINISFMEVGRLAPRGRAMMVLGLDDPVTPQALEDIRRIPGLESARVVQL